MRSLKAKGLIRPQAGVKPLYIDRFRFCHNPEGVTEQKVGLSPLRGLHHRCYMRGVHPRLCSERPFGALLSGILNFRKWN